MADQRMNKFPIDPSLTDLMTMNRRQVLLDTNCHAVATVQSFDEDTQTLTATMNYTKTIFQPGPDGVVAPVQINYPVMVDMPVLVLSGGEAALTMPIAQGDQCLVCFNDRDLDNWYQGSTNGTLASSRLHSFADGIAIVGLHNTGNQIEDYDTARAVLRNGEASVGVGEELILIKNELHTLKGIINGLIDVIAGLTITAPPGTGGGPCVITTAPLNSYKTTVGELLE